MVRSQVLKRKQTVPETIIKMVTQSSQLGAKSAINPPHWGFMFGSLALKNGSKLIYYPQSCGVTK